MFKVNDNIIQVVVIGDESVGKTSLIYKLIGKDDQNRKQII